MVKESDIRSGVRNDRFVYPRHMFCYVSNKLGFNPYDIEAFLQKHRTTVLHAIGRIKNDINVDDKYNEDVQMHTKEDAEYLLKQCWLHKKARRKLTFSIIFHKFTRQIC
jgi:hypothetical protein